jgi:hypothetical protein
MTRKVDAILMTDIMQGANVGMVQRRNGVGFAIKTLLSLGIVREMTWQDFDRDRTVQASVLRSIHLAHTAGADRHEDLIRAKAGAGRKGHVVMEQFYSARNPH